MRRAVLALIVGVALGFGVGYAVLEWQPWDSGGKEASTHDAEIALLKSAGGAAAFAACERREYPSNVFDCTIPHHEQGNEGEFVKAINREHPCKYVVRSAGDAFDVESNSTNPNDCPSA